MSEHRYKWMGLFALIPSFAMVFLDQTILPVALPAIQKSFGTGDIALQWSVNAYLLAIAALVLLGGKCSDWMGHRRAYVTAMSIFAAASWLCGASPSYGWLVAARALQGVGASLLFPSSISLLMGLFRPEERGRSSGINVSVSSLFLIIGPLLGGYLTQTYSWPWVFWINLPLAAFGILCAFLFLPNIPGRPVVIDRQGFVAYLLASGSFVTILMEGSLLGWTSLPMLLLVMGCLLSTIWLVVRERRAQHPYLELALFRLPIFRATSTSIASTAFILTVGVFWAVYFQKVLHYAPIETGWLSFASALPVMFMSPLAGLLSDRLGPRMPISCGFGLTILGLVWVAFFNQASWELLLIGLLLYGIGIPMVLTPSYAAAMNTVPPAKMGAASGSLATTRSLASTLGVAGMTGFLSYMQLYFMQKALEQAPAVVALDHHELRHLLVANSTSLPTDEAQALDTILYQAHVSSFFSLQIALAVLLAIAWIFTLRFYHRHADHRQHEAPGDGWD